MVNPGSTDLQNAEFHLSPQQYCVTHPAQQHPHITSEPRATELNAVSTAWQQLTKVSEPALEMLPDLLHTKQEHLCHQQRWVGKMQVGKATNIMMG